MSYVLMVLVLIGSPALLGADAIASATSTAVRFPSLASCQDAAARLLERWQSRGVEIRATCVAGPL